MQKYRASTSKQCENHYCDHSKRTMEHSYTQSSCFFTPESAEKAKDMKDFGRVTPIFGLTSSVFLSPPSSSERSPVPNFKNLDDVPRLDLQTEESDQESRISKSCSSRSSLLPEDRIIGKHVSDKIDIISELLTLGADRICYKICHKLGDSDLIRFASVCQRWRQFVEDFLSDRWRSHLRERRQYCTLKGKENLGTPQSSKDHPRPRIPLLTIDMNTAKSISQVVSITESSAVTTEMFVNPQTPVSERRLCPRCTSPSNYTQVQNVAQCICERCGNEFCPYCLRDIENHTSESCQELRTAPEEKRQLRTRKAKKNQASKRIRDSLRRL
ncbi:predicted protein [Nematostella vectensis]|uniref:ZBR-type domain-containing protein n=1 Tax=Nematostella vectensis TaxID=45351 RepID=A7SPE7_NEMVE|nr:predicted protein [Nematostella vectensis]|eukprot:XP_001626524.1 predicted protein [Nematostella vectensis]